MSLRTKLQKLLLTGLTLLPISSVAFAAESRLTDLVNEELRRAGAKGMEDSANRIELNTASVLDPELSRARASLFPPMTYKTGKPDAKRRFSEINPDLSGAEVDLAFERTIALLHQRGLIEVDEREITSHVPSRY